MGRPRKYASDAERQRAYRERRRAAKWGRIPGREWLADVDSPSHWGKIGNVVRAAKREHIRTHAMGEHPDECLWCAREANA